MTFSLQPGALVGGAYKLDRLLGVGGMGQVWSAEHQSTHAFVAIKFLKDDRMSPEARRRLLKEARASSAVDHPAIVQVRDVLESDVGEPALVMDLLRGESLESRPKPVTPREAARLLLPVAEALGAAHRVGIVHRDIKPDNVFLTESGEVKVLDFGIAKQVHVDADTAASAGTQTCAILGTPMFMSPEQAFAEGDIDHRTDIWSLGLVAYECLSGVLPTRADNLGQVLRIIITHRIPRLSEVAPDVPSELADLIDRMLQRDRSRRPQDMAEVVAVLSAIAAGTARPSGNGVVLRVGDSDSNDAWGETQVPAQSSSVVSGDSADSFLRQIAATPRSSRPEVEPDRSGQRISHYAVQSKIGQGGMGVVYAAEDVRLRRKVALKVLPAGFVANEDRRRRFLREARSASAVQHANVATVFDVGEADDTVYIAMEYVEGHTLRALLDAEGGRIEAQRALDIALQMAKGLAKAHASGVIHRDIKPENVMIAPDGSVKLLDFGLAKLSRAPEPLALGEEGDDPKDDLASRAGKILGTPAYMSPEQAAGTLVDSRTDVYAMGVTLYEMLVGARPKRGSGVDSSMRPRLSPRVVAVLDKCLQESPEGRYADARELGDALQAAAASRSTPEARRSRSPIMVAGAAAVALVAGVGWWSSQKPTAAAPSTAVASTSSGVTASSVGSPPDRPGIQAPMPAMPPGEPNLTKDSAAAAAASAPVVSAPKRPAAGPKPTATATATVAPVAPAVAPTLKPQTW